MDGIIKTPGQVLLLAKGAMAAGGKIGPSKIGNDHTYINVGDPTESPIAITNSDDVNDTEESIALDGMGEIVIHVKDGNNDVDLILNANNGVEITGDLKVNGSIKDKQNYEVVGVANNADAHNAIFRGKDLTNVYTIDQLSAKVQAANWEDLYIGDYITKEITIDGNTTTQKWRFAAFDWYLGTGDVMLTTHHIVMVPGILFSKSMNATNVTTGGYKGSHMWTETMPQVRTGLNNAFGSTHVLKRRNSISNTVNTSTPSMAGAGLTGASTSCEWVDSWVTLLTEPEVYGTTVFSSSGYDIGVGHTQLPLFKHSKQFICSRSVWWLSAVVSATYFAFVDGYGAASSYGAAYSYGVRPAWLFY